MLVGDTADADAARKKAETEVAVGAEMAVEKDESAGEKIFHRASLWKQRILDFTSDKQIPPDSVDIVGKGAQVAYSNIAIASSGVIGVGPGNSEERDFLSQAFSDFIYSIIIEELGILGAFFVAFLYIVLLFRAGYIANKCENNFPAFLAMGLALMLVTQALMNMCVAVGLVPVTGQPLPLISKGGTSTIINCIYIGAILSVSRSAKKRTA
jgi:cell division protein FtsW